MGRTRIEDLDAKYAALDGETAEQYSERIKKIDEQDAKNRERHRSPEKPKKQLTEQESYKKFCREREDDRYYRAKMLAINRGYHTALLGSSETVDKTNYAVENHCDIRPTQDSKTSLSVAIDTTGTKNTDGSTSQETGTAQERSNTGKNGGERNHRPKTYCHLLSHELQKHALRQYFFSTIQHRNLAKSHRVTGGIITKLIDHCGGSVISRDRYARWVGVEGPPTHPLPVYDLSPTLPHRAEPSCNYWKRRRKIRKDETRSNSDESVATQRSRACACAPDRRGPAEMTVDQVLALFDFPMPAVLDDDCPRLIQISHGDGDDER